MRKYRDSDAIDVDFVPGSATVVANVPPFAAAEDEATDSSDKSS